MILNTYVIQHIWNNTKQNGICSVIHETDDIYLIEETKLKYKLFFILDVYIWHVDILLKGNVLWHFFLTVWMMVKNMFQPFLPFVNVFDWFVWWGGGGPTHSRTFHYHGDVTSTCDCTRQPWVMRSGLTCMVRPFIRSYATTCDTNTCFRAFVRGAVIPSCNDIGLSKPGNERHSFACEVNVVLIGTLWFGMQSIWW